MTGHQRRRIYLMRHGSVTYFDEQGKPFLQGDSRHTTMEVLLSQYRKSRGL